MYITRWYENRYADKIPPGQNPLWTKSPSSFVSFLSQRLLSLTKPLQVFNGRTNPLRELTSVEETPFMVLQGWKKFPLEFAKVNKIPFMILHT